MATANGNEYEKARAFRIQQNQIKLNALGVREASSAVKPVAAPAKPRPKRRVEKPPVGPPRKSARNEGKPAPTYKTLPEPSEARPPRQRARGSGQRAVDPAHFPVATLAARKIAEDAAYALADQLNEKAGRAVAAAKVMLPSHVSGGFWLQNPPAIVQAIGISESEDIELECFEPSTREDGFANVLSGKEHRWKMVYLVRSGSSGMSGGWRGAAIDHALTTNDTIVFEVLPNVQPRVVRMHVFRAETSAETTVTAQAGP